MRRDPPPYPSARSFLDHKSTSAAERKARQLAITLVFAGAAAAFAFVFLPPFIRWFHPTPKHVLIEGPASTVDLSKGDVATWDKWDRAAHVALAKWQSILPDILPDGFKLVAAPDACAALAIACADAARRAIFVVQPGNDVDRTTIMMHEIGHLIGVPHIIGDPLMDPAYQGHALDAPSERALALATVEELHRTRTRSVWVAVPTR